MIRYLLIVSLIINFVAGKMKFADPKPTFENPRRVVMKLNRSDLDYVKHLLGTIYNILKEYPSDSLKVVVIAYGPGMRALRRDFNKKELERIKSLMNYDVEFIGCLNTMATMKWKKDEFIDNIDYVQAGVAELIEKKASGWIDATPY